MVVAWYSSNTQSFDRESEKKEDFQKTQHWN